MEAPQESVAEGDSKKARGPAAEGVEDQHEPNEERAEPEEHEDGEVGSEAGADSAGEKGSNDRPALTVKGFNDQHTLLQSVEGSDDIVTDAEHAVLDAAAQILDSMSTGSA